MTYSTLGSLRFFGKLRERKKERKGERGGDRKRESESNKNASKNSVQIPFVNVC